MYLSESTERRDAYKISEQTYYYEVQRNGNWEVLYCHCVKRRVI